MKKEITCSFTATKTIEVDIPDRLLEVFEDNDDYSYWYPNGVYEKDKLIEIYDIINNEICKDLMNLEWEDIAIISSNDIEE